MPFKNITRNSKGFTLVEIIVTIVAAGILGVIFVHFMGTALDASWNAVEITRAESGAEALMEQIIGEYVALINNDPANALDTIDDYDGQTINGISIAATYIEFNDSGQEIAPSTNNTLKVVLSSSGPGAPAISGRYPITIILTYSRTADDDPIVLY